MAVLQRPRRSRAVGVLRRALPAIGLATAVLAVGIGMAPTAEAGEPEAAALAHTLDLTGPVHSEGTRIVDGYGRTVLIHGVNNVDKGDDEQGRSAGRPLVAQGDGRTVSPQDAELLAGYGFNAVRLGISFAALMPQRGRMNQDYIERVVGVVGMLARHGIRTLIDNHQDGLAAPWGGNGFPDWAIAARPAAGEPNPGFPLYYLMPSMNAGWDEVWGTADGVLDSLGDALGAVAGALRGHPGALGIELINEPWPGSAWPTCFPAGCPRFDERYQGALESLTAAVRERNPGLPVYWEPDVTWNQMMPSTLGMLRPITDRNVVFAPHDYCMASQAGIYLGASDAPRRLCPELQAHTWANVDAMTARSGLPTVVTEFGDGDAAVLPDTLRAADKRFAGWLYWHYRSTRGPGYRLPDPFTDGEAGGDAVGRLLVRTYPQATAGTPVSMGFDPATGDFTYTYAPGPRSAEPGPAGVTVIYTSALHYPRGYTAHVEGGRVTSASDARLLTVRADGEGPVTVRVAAAG